MPQSSLHYLEVKTLFSEQGGVGMSRENRLTVAPGKPRHS